MLTYSEMLKAEAEYRKATEPAKIRKQRGATKEQLAYRAMLLGRRACCVNCGEPFGLHSLQQTLDCANERS